MFELLILIIVLGLVVYVHELGHFVVAKRAGMEVREFGFGFPPRIFGIKRGETIYSINWIPFGGFVSILGEDGTESDNPRSYSAAGAYTRMRVLVAGVVMNLLLAFVLFSGVNMIGAPIATQLHADADQARILVRDVIADTPAALAGMDMGDEIIGYQTGVTGTPISDNVTLGGIQTFVQEHAGTEIILLVMRDNVQRAVTLIPRVDPPEGQGAMGIAMEVAVDFTIFESIWYGIKDTLFLLKETVIGIGKLLHNVVAGDRSLAEGIAGPVGIAVHSGEAARSGVGTLMFWTGYLSLNLAILNILPIPPLDGGKLMFTIIEKLRRGKALSMQTQIIWGNVGVLLLLALMVYATIKDIVGLV